MQTETPMKKTRSALALSFAAGAGLGALVAAVPFSAGYASELSIVHVSVVGIVVVTSGVLSCVWGDRFLDSVSKALHSTSV